MTSLIWGMIRMKAITLRGIKPLVMDNLKKEAKKNGKSINQYLLDIIHRQLGMEKEKKYTLEHDDLDDLFGKWSEKEFDQIQSKIDSERVIDEELWT